MEHDRENFRALFKSIIYIDNLKSIIGPGLAKIKFT